ncbi:MAG: hypothetical protein ACI856_002440, partial [Kiritimatiellia bacterium]
PSHTRDTPNDVILADKCPARDEIQYILIFHTYALHDGGLKP